MKDINNLTLEQKKEIAQLICDDEYGFEGRNTYPACGNCIVCLCRKETKYNAILGDFEENITEVKERKCNGCNRMMHEELTILTPNGDYICRDCIICNISKVNKR